MLKLDLQYFAGAVDTWHIYVKSNDGSTQLFDAWSTSNTTVTITESGFTLSGGTIYGDGSTYTYEGNKTLLGFATSANATEPTYTTGDTLTLTADGVNMHLYIVEDEAEPTTSGVTVEYNDEVVVTIPSGNKATIPVADKKMKTDIIITVSESSSEVLPEFTEVEDFTVMVSGLEGEMEISYDVSEKVALPSGYNQLTSVNDANFIASNIKKGVSIFDLVGAYEGETIEEYDGTIVIEDIAPEEEKVNITLKADNGGGNTMCSTYVKFGEAPSSNYDSEYFCMGGNLDIKQGNESSYDSHVSLGTDSINIAVNPVAYIWVPQTDNMAGYKLNGGSLINVGTGCANATEVQLSEGDVLTILSTWLD